MTDAQMQAYILFASLLILVSSSAGLSALFLWVIPDAVAAFREHRDETPAAVYSRWQLFRLGMHCLKLALFLVPATTVLVMETSDLRLLINITALLAIALAVATTAITEPVGRRQVEAAIREEEAARKEESLRGQVAHMREDRDRAGEHQDRMEEMQQQDLDISERVETKLDEAKKKLEGENGTA